ncbi:hypothetical protein CQS04_07020 [Chryseomicrobium excrementi]|uniref:SLH domain-containing protein n=1 Tax=Chryseomicrobium excrementi TaxID=2041346 RepID=A0A2M9F0B3_9BACL|nr:S-layer homology domain-containing protein [Chryseomicrobium excrementi]PJK16897.1 hypothetical protein CQS04_07020 [Chryseomicrobium excrementi]
MKPSIKKAAGLALATAVLTTGLVPTASAQSASFTDVPKTNVHYDNIYNLANRDIISGYPDGTYQPAKNLTRAEAAVLLVKALGLKTEDHRRSFFPDVKQDSWYMDDINALVQNEIISGYENGNFGPNDNLTRAQMATILANAYELYAASEIDIPFTDVQAGAWYDEAVQGLYRFDVTAGASATKFAPKALVRRDEMASFVVNAEKVFEEEKAEEWMATRVSEYNNTNPGDVYTATVDTDQNLIHVTIAPTDRNLESSDMYEVFYTLLPIEQTEEVYVKGQTVNVAELTRGDGSFFYILDQLGAEFEADANELSGKYITLVFKGAYGEEFEYTVTFINETP